MHFSCFFQSGLWLATYIVKNCQMIQYRIVRNFKLQSCDSIKNIDFNKWLLKKWNGKITMTTHCNVSKI